ncbi:hypothetical protein AWB80_08146 [Caballeronia pedi]|uniref:Uncharacterized protein n=1 Tax=Caballeronia pedi TaxID=1777141 RepID=A0A158E3U2_9BURK|nr:hypothetical protein AWB80_08146 [Caballeronia pedi]
MTLLLWLIGVLFSTPARRSFLKPTAKPRGRRHVRNHAIPVEYG